VIFTDETGGRELCILIGGVSVSLYSALTALLVNLVMVIVLTSVLQGAGIASGKSNLHVLFVCTPGTNEDQASLWEKSFLVRVCCMVLPNSMLPTLRIVLVG
jgi:hypothetical protein